jgi:predicted phage-related endonuclease
MSDQAYTSRTYENRFNWLQARQMGVGATDTPAILGESSYRSSYAAAVDKIRPIETEADNPIYFDIGRDIQNTILKIAGSTSDLYQYDCEPDQTIRTSSKWPWLCCSLDGIVWKVGEFGVAEVKNVVWGQDKWTDDTPPLEYVLQVQHQLAVTGFKYGEILALFSLSKLRIYPIERDDDLIENVIVPQTKLWWDNLQAGIMPEPDGSDSSRKAIERMYPDQEPGKRIVLPEQFNALDAERTACLGMRNAADGRVKAINNQILVFMQDCELAEIPGVCVYKKGERLSRKGIKE